MIERHPDDLKYIDRLGRTIARFRAKKGMTQEILAIEAGLATNTVAKLERGVKNPTVSTIFHICDALHITMGELFTAVDSFDTDHEQIDRAVSIISSIPDEYQREQVIDILSNIAQLV